MMSSVKPSRFKLPEMLRYTPKNLLEMDSRTRQHRHEEARGVIRKCIAGIVMGATLGGLLECVNAVFTFLLPPGLIILPLCILLGGGIATLCAMGR